MDAQNQSHLPATVVAAPATRLHPLLAGAAIAVTLASVVGAAAMLGWLPNSRATEGASAATPAQVTVVQPVVQPAVQPPATRTVTVKRYVDVPRQRYESAPTYAAPTQTAYQPSYQPAHQPTTGVGAVGGAVVGGLLGNQIGHGRGRTLATVAGALGGGLLGNTVESRVRNSNSY
ncbi:glycine zipper 2TM domain-containing protein [Chitinasiproducens palmae]|uniref:Glycine zipper 2TM domain-containing protein n=1 Tax=Chitinasiproducens palmae TaxID=1770053 RepID=A0A1H2PR49_9BURK|nr:glycine zipper 2TM domain-containing protein [Chitinasiproducens palmae]SDV49354.1 Glycine zipper 2TM domain-containing protein [Chitinasiproducens palmae]